MDNNHAKFQPDPIRNDAALGFFEECHLNKKNNKIKRDQLWSKTVKCILLSVHFLQWLKHFVLFERYA